jgi:hypothetical protein
VARSSWALTDGEAVSLSLWALATLPPHGHAVATEHRVPGPRATTGSQAATQGSRRGRRKGQQATDTARAPQAGPVSQQGGVDHQQQHGEGVEEDLTANEVQEMEQALAVMQASTSGGRTVQGSSQNDSRTMALGLGATSNSIRRGDNPTWLVGCLVRLSQVAPTLSAPAVANTFHALAELGGCGCM